MTQNTPQNTVLMVADLRQNAPNRFAVEPDGPARGALAQELDLLELPKLRFTGEIRAAGKNDWMLSGVLGATVVQPCVATLAPVKTRLDQPVERLFLAGYQSSEEPESEMPEDDRIEPLGDRIDLGAILAEALSLALPAYPRAEGSGAVELRVTEPGKEALSDDDVKPFAALKALRDQLSGDE